MIKYCIFDLDGTLLNTINTISYYANMALDKNGLDSIETEKYNYFVGEGAKVLADRMLKHLDKYTPELASKLLKDYVSEYDKDTNYLTVVYDGIFELIEGLEARGIKSVVLTNKPQSSAELVLEKFFPGVFAECLGVSEGVVPKPDPTQLFSLMERNGLKKEDCIYVGDTGTDMKTAKGADIVSFGALWGFREENELRDNGARYIVASPTDILPIIDEINK